MSLIRNAWYAAAWADEVGDGLFSRTILAEPVVLFREASGRAVALLDVCPHRFAPLRLGTKVGDVVQCGYHGLQFDGTGACVHNPQGNGAIPRAAKVKAYPLVERYGLLWIWPGDPSAANDLDIPRYEQLTDPSRRTVRGGNSVNCNYRLLVDNLMDLGHFQYLHHASAGPVSDFDKVHIEVAEEGASVIDRRTYRGVTLSGFWAAAVDDPNAIVDFWQDIRWTAVGALRNHVGAAPPGQARTGGIDQMGTHLLTPESETRTHYFYANSRNYDLDESGDEAWRIWQRRALGEEDKPMVEAIEQLAELTAKYDMRGVLLQSDGAAMRVTRKLDALIQSERTAPRVERPVLQVQN
jgi:vanillate O-demethylase monooxygenase subunit